MDVVEELSLQEFTKAIAVGLFVEPEIQTVPIRDAHSGPGLQWKGLDPVLHGEQVVGHQMNKGNILRAVHSLILSMASKLLMCLKTFSLGFSRHELSSFG